MDKICFKCSSRNATAARFCQQCGTVLDAATIDGRTVVMQPGSPSLSPSEVQTIVQRTQQTFGAGPIEPAIAAGASLDQREHLVAVLDISGSMAGPYDKRYTKLQAAVRAEISMIAKKGRIDANDEVGIVVFNGRASVALPICPISSHKTQMISVLQSLTPNNGTDINEGLKAARDLFGWHRNGVVRRIVLLTDGHGGDPLHTAEDLKSRGVVIDVIGVGADPSGVDERLLKLVASTIDGELHYHFIKDQQTLVDHMTQLGNKTAVQI